MKNCFRATRLFLPRGGFEKWAVPAADSHASDRTFWERVAKNIGNAPSCLNLILPDVYDGEEADAADAIAAKLYDTLAEEKLDRIGRSFLFVERTLKDGRVRTGIVAALDLEQFSFAHREVTPVRATEAPSPRAETLKAFRAKTLLEFPHILLFYRDKKMKLARMLSGYDLETLYDFPLMEEGGRICGSFIGEDYAYDVAEEMTTRGEPCFAVADGHDEIAAAKMYWEELKPTLKGAEVRNHPARFALVECINIYDPAVEIRPVHRLVTDTDEEAFADYFARNIKCKRQGHLLYCMLPAGADAVRRADGVISAYLRANGGKVEYFEDTDALSRRGEGIGVIFRPIEKDDLFYDIKGGELMPRHTFTIGEENKRYSLEGREISYD